MILHLYFARRFAMIFLMLTLVMYALIALIDLVDQTRSFGALDIGFPSILALTLLNVPETLNQILPLITILATVALFISLARSSELVVTRAAGRSGLGTLVAPAVLSLLIGAIAVTMLNPIVASTSKRYDALAESHRTGGASTLSISGEGLWLRQGGEDRQTVISARRSNGDASVLIGVTFLELVPGRGPIRRIDAHRASLQNRAWLLHGAKEWPLERGVNPEGAARSHDELILPSTLTVDRIRESLSQPNAISIWNLQEFISQLDRAGFSSRQHRVHLQSELARPFFLLSMVLVAAAFTMRPTRLGGTGRSVLTAVLLGFALYFVRSFAEILGENGQIPILLAAWAPPAASICLALGLLLHAEDG
ncbi:MAG: LPS export ABC transporter permease LptG [Pseudomonadota bacterium]